MKYYRLLIYEGPDNWVKATYENCWVPIVGTKQVSTGKTITSIPIQPEDLTRNEERLMQTAHTWVGPRTREEGQSK